MQEEDGKFYPEPVSSDGGQDQRVILALKVLKQMQEGLQHVIHLFESGNPEEAQENIAKIMQGNTSLDYELAEASGLRVVEGVFDGCQMIGPDGNAYQVPPNYASKSRLVEGDLLKLTIKKDGGFIFKQIAPIERRRVKASLAEDPETHEFVAVGEKKQSWKLLRASITYFHGTPGDDLVLLVPKSTPSSWAAVENVIKK